jgi:protein SCO1/2
MALTRRQALGTLAGITASIAASPRAARALALPGPAGAIPGGGPRRLPNVPLTTHEGRRVRFYDDLVKDRIVLINFMYVKCEGVCPGMTANLARVQRALGDRVGRDVFMYSITLKPHEDPPEALRGYMRMHAIGPGWEFLTGRRDDVDLVRRTLGFVDPDPALDADVSNHTGLVLGGNDGIDRWAACPALAEPSAIVEFVGWMGRSKAPPSLSGR